MLFGQRIHTRARRKIVRRLLAAMQHHDQGQLVRCLCRVALWDIQLVDSRACLIGERAGQEPAARRFGRRYRFDSFALYYLGFGVVMRSAVERSAVLSRGLSQSCRRQCFLDRPGDSRQRARRGVESGRRQSALDRCVNSADIDRRRRMRFSEPRQCLAQAERQTIKSFQNGAFELKNI